MYKIILLMSLSCIFMREEHLVTIDATSYSDWVYYSFSSHSILDCDNEGTICAGDEDWDIAFQRKHMRTNSGLAGLGNGGAYVDSSAVWTEDWASVHQIPDNAYWYQDTLFNDFYDLQTHTYVEGVKNPALNSWGWFDETFSLNPTNYTMFVKCANGQDAVKFWAYDYYLNTRVGGVISIRYETGYTIGCDSSGDINQDGVLNLLDVVTIVQSIVNDIELDEQGICIADVNSDEIADVLDIIYIIQLILDA